MVKENKTTFGIIHNYVDKNTFNEINLVLERLRLLAFELKLTLSNHKVEIFDIDEEAVYISDILNLQDADWVSTTLDDAIDKYKNIIESSDDDCMTTFFRYMLNRHLEHSKITVEETI